MSRERERFLASLGEALGRQASAPGRLPKPPAPGGDLPRRADHPGTDPGTWPARFAAELEAVGGTAEIVPPGEAARRAAAYAAGLGVRRVLAWDPAALTGEAAALLTATLEALSASGFEVQTWPTADAAEAELGVVVAEAAVAASGTVMVSGGKGKGRSVSLLPEHLLVLVPAAVLRPTLAEVLAQLARRTRSGDIPQNVALITGPSKSADIEQKMIMGVHGPRTVHALVAAPAP